MKSTGYSHRNLEEVSDSVPVMPSPPYQPLRSNWRDVLRQLIADHAEQNPEFLHGGKPSLRAYSLKIGTNPTLVWEWFERKPKKEPQFSSVVKLMTILRKPISLLTEEENVTVASPPSRVKVIGIVEAGAWREPEMLDFQDELSVPAVLTLPFAKLKQSGWIVRGQSINRVAQDGDALITVRFEELERAPRDGDLVICERHRHGQVEYTAKRYRVEADLVRLDPDSTDPRFQTPVWMPEDEDGDEEVVVKAEHLVIWTGRMLAKD